MSLGVRGHAVAQLFERHCSTIQKVAASILDSLRPHNNSKFDSDSNRNEYQEYLLKVKGGRFLGLTTLPLSCADCLEIWNLILLQPYGPVQGFI